MNIVEELYRQADADERAGTLYAHEIGRKAADEIKALRNGLEDKADLVAIALRRAWQLGQTYWQQADSDFISHHRKADETQAKFQALVDETKAAVVARSTED